MRQQGHFFADRRQVVEGAHGHIHLVAHALAIHQNLGRIFSLRVPLNLPIIECLSLGKFQRIINLILRHTFSPSNNTRLGHVCGAMDEHLRTIEVGLTVKISHSHEKFRIDGHKAKATRALEVLQALYEQAAKPIPKEQVQLMLAGDEHMGSHKDGSLGLTTRRNDVQARTPTQALYLEKYRPPRHHLWHWPCWYR